MGLDGLWGRGDLNLVLEGEGQDHGRLGGRPLPLDTQRLVVGDRLGESRGPGHPAAWRAQGSALGSALCWARSGQVEVGCVVGLLLGREDLALGSQGQHPGARTAAQLLTHKEMRLQVTSAKTQLVNI